MNDFPSTGNHPSQFSVLFSPYYIVNVREVAQRGPMSLCSLKAGMEVSDTVPAEDTCLEFLGRVMWKDPASAREPSCTVPLDQSLRFVLARNSHSECH